MTDTNGRSRLWPPISWAVAISLAGALVGYGATQNRLATAESHVKQTDIDQRQTERRVNEHDTQIAKLDTKLDEILRRLDRIDRKLEHEERRQ